MENTFSQITVTIPAQEWDVNKYEQPSDCYLGEQVQKVIPNSKICLSIGYDENGTFRGRMNGGLHTKARIQGEYYITKYPFNEDIVKDAFAKGQDIKVTLVKI